MTPELEALRQEYKMNLNKRRNTIDVEIYIMIGLVYLIWRILA